MLAVDICVKKFYTGTVSWESPNTPRHIIGMTDGTCGNYGGEQKCINDFDCQT
jgi:hypothetical protein